MNDFLIYWLSCLFEFLIFFALGIGFTRKFNSSIIKNGIALAIPLSAISTFIEYYLLNDVDSLFLNLLILYIFLLILFKQSSINTILVLLLSFASAMTIQLLLVLMFSVVPIPESIPIELFGNATTLIITIVFAITKFLSEIYKFVTSRKLPFLIAITNIFALTLVLNIFNKLSPDRYTTLIVSILIPFTAIIYMNLVFIKEYYKQVQEEKKNMIYTTYLPVIDEMLDQIRKRQHNFDNELQTIKGLSDTCSDYETLKSALNEYSGYIENTLIDTQLLKLNLRFLAALLYQKAEQAKKSNIDMTLSIISPILYSNTPEYEVIEIAGILIDNMLEATPPHAKCRVSFESKKNKIIITTINPSPPVDTAMLSLMFTKGYTTKDNRNLKHGYGLHNLSELVNKNNGKIFSENQMSDDIPQLLISVEI